MTVPRTRKELASFISDRLTTNREAQEKTGKYRVHQLKVFWLEVNHEHHPSAAFSTGWTTTDRDFHVFAGDVPEEDSAIWLDTGSPRIWYAFSFARREQVERTLRTQMLSIAGIDRVWLTEQFMEHVKKVHSYQGRGFGIFFRDSLAESPVPYERPRFSAKFWLGPSIPDRHKAFLDSAEETFSRSSLRLGRPSEDPDSRVSGLLLELYAEGSLTINISEDPEEVLGLVREVGEEYARQLTTMESSRQRNPRPIELKFVQPINLDRFQRLVRNGIGKTRLWMQEYEDDEELRRYIGVDLHTKEMINLDVAPEYAYLTTEREGCMNAAPRLMTLSAQRLSGKTEIYYEGAQLFA
jgi:hypothetical protein